MTARARAPSAWRVVASFTWGQWPYRAGEVLGEDELVRRALPAHGREWVIRRGLLEPVASGPDAAGAASAAARPDA